mmetsp:Transcript_16592/g.55786  ORF Transcript_16592/g.55786 Transcript_16592/m.55786 type:complete len:230 (-) Transcript_16592:37-726(-)
MQPPRPPSTTAPAAGTSTSATCAFGSRGPTGSATTTGSPGNLRYSSAEEPTMRTSRSTRTSSRLQRTSTASRTRTSPSWSWACARPRSTRTSAARPWSSAHPRRAPRAAASPTPLSRQPRGASTRARARTGPWSARWCRATSRASRSPTSWRRTGRRASPRTRALGGPPRCCCPRSGSDCASWRPSIGLRPYQLAGGWREVATQSDRGGRGHHGSLSILPQELTVVPIA